MKFKLTIELETLGMAETLALQVAFQEFVKTANLLPAADIPADRTLNLARAIAGGQATISRFNAEKKSK